MTNLEKTSPINSLLRKNACNDPIFEWQNRQDFEFANRGQIHRPDDPAIFDSDENPVLLKRAGRSNHA